MARTKQTGPTATKPAAKKLRLNSTPKPTEAPPTPVKSPAQPAELSEYDREQVKSWLDDPSTAWKVVTAPLSKKRKRNGPMQPQTDIFEDRLSVQYEVRPRDKWECMRRYKKFTGTWIGTLD